jgi:hypothetical protein
MGSYWLGQEHAGGEGSKFNALSRDRWFGSFSGRAVAVASQEGGERGELTFDFLPAFSQFVEAAAR